MSRGFVREDDQEEPTFIPPRASLPEGVVNHVTPRGMQLLLEERTALELERTTVQVGNETERRRELALINGKLALLNERIAQARVVDAGPEVSDEVRFGATVRFRVLNGPQSGVERVFTVVGVDEASIAEGRIAFTSPIARALMGKRPGDHVRFTLGAAVQELHVLAVTYG